MFLIDAEMVSEYKNENEIVGQILKHGDVFMVVVIVVSVTIHYYSYHRIPMLLHLPTVLLCDLYRTLLKGEGHS